MTDCSHWWIIETAVGPTSPAKCKLCGEEREFQNSFNDHAWFKTGQRRFADDPAYLKRRGDD